jgi:hypothetical protein
MNARAYRATFLVLGAAFGAGSGYATPSACISGGGTNGCGAVNSGFSAVPFGSSQAPGGIIFDQTPTNTNGHSITDSRLADDFTLATQNTVQGINFYYKAFSISDLSEVTYAIYNNSGGALGSVIQTETIASGNVTRTGSALCPTCSLASFAISGINLSPGTYWLEVHAGLTLTSLNGGLAVDWAAVADNATFVARFSNNSGGAGGVPNTPVNSSGNNNYAFQLTGIEETPEPGTFVLLGLGLSLVAIKARRRSTTKFAA